MRQCLLALAWMGGAAATLCADLIPTPPEPPPPPDGGNVWSGIALAVGICLGGLWLARRMLNKQTVDHASNNGA